MRKIYLVGSINEEMYIQFSKELDELTKTSKKPILVELCSEGGDDNIAFALYGKIRSSLAPIHMLSFGQVQSAAVLIFAAAHKRISDPECLFMVHESSDDLTGETKDLKAKVQRMEKDEERFYKLLEKHSQLEYSRWRQLAKETTYFTAKEAKSYGIVDGIL